MFPKEKEGFIQVTGGKVYYHIFGAEKKETPLLILHGGPGFPFDYMEPLKILANERPVIFYDQLGCGKSDLIANQELMTVARYVDELEQVRSELKLDDVILLGQSWGTMLAVEYILRKNPIGIKGLILSAPYLSTKIWVADQRRWIAQLPQEIQDTIRKYEELGDYSAPAFQEAMMSFYNRHVCRLEPWPSCLLSSLEKLNFDVYQYMWGPSEFIMTGILKEADLTEKLNQISIPTLLTCGEYDEATPEATAYYQSLIPNSEMHVFKDASHSHHLEKFEEYVQVIRNFNKF